MSEMKQKGHLPVNHVVFHNFIRKPDLSEGRTGCLNQSKLVLPFLSVAAFLSTHKSFTMNVLSASFDVNTSRAEDNREADLSSWENRNVSAVNLDQCKYIIHEHLCSFFCTPV